METTLPSVASEDKGKDKSEGKRTSRQGLGEGETTIRIEFAIRSCRYRGIPRDVAGDARAHVRPDIRRVSVVFKILKTDFYFCLCSRGPPKFTAH